MQKELKLVNRIQKNTSTYEYYFNSFQRQPPSPLLSVRPLDLEMKRRPLCRQLRPPQYHVRRLHRDHLRGRIQISTDNARHHAGVDNTQIVHAAHAQLNPNLRLEARARDANIRELEQLHLGSQKKATVTKAGLTAKSGKAQGDLANAKTDLAGAEKTLTDIQATFKLKKEHYNVGLPGVG